MKRKVSGIGEVDGDWLGLDRAGLDPHLKKATEKFINSRLPSWVTEKTSFVAVPKGTIVRVSQSGTPVHMTTYGVQGTPPTAGAAYKMTLGLSECDNTVYYTAVEKVKIETQNP